MVRYTIDQKENAKRFKIKKIEKDENIEFIAELHKDMYPFETIDEFEQLKKNKKVKNCSLWMTFNKAYKLILYEDYIIEYINTVSDNGEVQTEPI